jgi:hypothetical protein
MRLISYDTFGANNKILWNEGTCWTTGRTLGQSQENGNKNTINRTWVQRKKIIKSSWWK